MTLTVRGYVTLPPHATGGGFDHGNVHAATGRLFIAHSASESLEVVDGDTLKHERTVPGCPDASGVLCTQGAAALVFAAARRAGKVLVLDPLSCQVHRELTVGRPDGMPPSSVTPCCGSFTASSSSPVEMAVIGGSPDRPRTGHPLWNRLRAYGAWYGAA